MGFPAPDLLGEEGGCLRTRSSVPEGITSHQPPRGRLIGPGTPLTFTLIPRAANSELPNSSDTQRLANRAVKCRAWEHRHRAARAQPGPRFLALPKINALTLRLGEGRNDAATNPQLAGAHGLLSSTHGKGHGSDAKAQRLVALLFHAVMRGAGQGPGSVSPPGAAGADVAADHVGEGGEQESGDTSPTAPCCRGADVEADTCSPCR